MFAAKVNGLTIHYRIDGPSDAPTLVFANSLGTDFRIWDPILPLLPTGWQVVRYDKRGHGLSDLPDTDWGMADHVADAAGLLRHLGLSKVVFCGLSVGGMIAQGLAAEHPDLVRALILCDTGAKIGTPDLWEERTAMVRKTGLPAMSDGVMQRWFTAPFIKSNPTLPIWRNMLARTTAEGYAKTCEAIGSTDLMESTSRLRLPCLGLCGDQDMATPPDLVREVTDLIPDSRFELIRGAGHIPCVEQPEAMAAEIGRFLGELLPTS